MKYLVITISFCTLLAATAFGQTPQNITWENLFNVTASANELEKTGGTTGWGFAAASSEQQIPAGQDGAVTWTAVTYNKYYMVGLSVDHGTNFSTIDYALYLAPSNKVRIFENGTEKSIPYTAYSANVEYEVRKVGNVITYLKNGTAFYTSTISASSTQPYLVSVAMHTLGAKMVNPQITGGSMVSEGEGSWVKNNEHLVLSSEVSGNVGIGTQVPAELLTVNGGDMLLHAAPGVDADADFYVKEATGKGLDLWVRSSDQNGFLQTMDAGMDLVLGAGQWGEDLFIRDNGAVQIPHSLRIGTDELPAGYHMAVDGKIICEELTVELSPWMDIVFESDYELRPLEEVETFIENNKHLPEIPSAKEVENGDIGLGEMTRLQMKKIEELTLYLIQLKDQNEILQTRVDALEAAK